MALHTQFHRKLDQLWKRKTATLRSLIKPKPGMPLGFTRKTRDRMIGDLLELATQALLRRDARRSFKDAVVKRRLFHLRGRGRLARGESLASFAKTLSGPIVYAFWRGRHCLYVGKGKRPSRLVSHRKSYGREADSVEVYFVRSRSYLPKAECLATHLFQPRDLAMRPSRAAWGKNCPICSRHDRIRRELFGLFALR
ncbi:MAG: hypothetical protein JNL08_00795 [Planctomycetes bacterium]|nr:hypothetical protein [Planctomycetota bacterium]